MNFFKNIIYQHLKNKKTNYFQLLVGSHIFNGNNIMLIILNK